MDPEVKYVRVEWTTDRRGGAKRHSAEVELRKLPALERRIEKADGYNVVHSYSV